MTKRKCQNQTPSSSPTCIKSCRVTAEIKVDKDQHLPYCEISDFLCDHCEEGPRTAPGVPTCLSPPRVRSEPRDHRRRPPVCFKVSGNFEKGGDASAYVRSVGNPSHTHCTSVGSVCHWPSHRFPLPDCVPVYCGWSSRLGPLSPALQPCT